VRHNPATDRTVDAELRYRTLVEQLPLIVYMDALTAAAETIYISDQTEAILGYTAQEWLETPDLFAQALHPDDREWVLADTERVYVHLGPSAPLEYRLIAKDGRTVWVRDDAAPVRDEDGRVLYMQGFLLDISEQKRAEADLRRRDAILQAVGSGAERLLSEPLWTTAVPELLRELGEAAAVSRVYLYENHTGDRGELRARQLFRWTAAELPSDEELQDFGYEVAGFARWVGELGAGDVVAGHLTSLPEPERRKLQLIGVVSLLVVPIFSDGRWWGFIGFDECTRARDWAAAEIDALRAAAGILGAAITRDRGDERLRRREQSLRAIFENALDAIVIVDDAGRFVDANPASLELFGIARRDLLARRVGDFTVPEGRRALPSVWRRFLAEGSLENVFEIMRADGERRHVELTAKASFLPDRHIAVIRDVTERRRLEGELGRSQRLESLGRLAGGIAHDFNNLLTAISGYTGMLLEQPHADPAVVHDLREIERASQRAAELTGQLLAFGRRQTLRPEPLDLNAAVRDVEPMLRRLLGEEVELVASLEPDLGVVRADLSQLEQAIVNLAVNARDAMSGAGGRLTIATANAEWEQLPEVADLQPGRFVALTVSDTGSGMDAETAARVFEPFFTTKEDGTGLGLSSVYGTAQQSGGTVTIRTVLGEGSSFTILLPRVVERVAARDRPALRPRRADGAETILLVEDEESVRTLARRVLESGGYTVLDAGDGETALALAAAHPGPIDLLLTDVVMPGMRGTELATRLAETRPMSAVVFMSGYAHEAVTDEGLPADSFFIGKPFGPDALARAVREALDAAAELRP